VPRREAKTGETPGTGETPVLRFHHSGAPTMKQSRRIDWRGNLHQFSCLNMQIAVVASSDLAKLKQTNIGKSDGCLARVSLKAPRKSR